MKVYILKEKNVGNRPGVIFASFVCNDDVAPSATLQARLAARGYELQVHHPTLIANSGDFEAPIRDEIRIDQGLEPGEEWPDNDK